MLSHRHCACSSCVLPEAISYNQSLLLLAFVFLPHAQHIYIYISQPSHVAMFPPRKKACRIALSLSLRVFILGVNIPQKPSATRLTEMRTKALLLKLRGDSLSTESSPRPQTVVLLQLIGPYSLRNPGCGYSADSSNVLSSMCL